MTLRMAGPGPGLRIGAFLVLVLLHFSLAAPIDNEEDGQTQVQEYLGQEIEQTGCYYNFQHYEEADRIITNEPCLNCTCHNRMLMCYLRVCPFTKAIGQDCTIEKKADQCCPVINCPEVPVQLLTSSTTEKSSDTSLGQVADTTLGHPDDFGCKISDLFYTDGAQVPGDPSKPCELCYCIRNRTACVMQECTLRVEGCRPIYQEGVCCPVKYDCDYEETPRTTTTETPSSTPGLILTTTTAGPLDCRYNGQTYIDGASVETIEPCEHCYCMRGEMVCAVQECGTPLDKQNCTAVAPPAGTCCPVNFLCDENEIDAARRQNRKHDDEVNMTAEMDTTEPEIEAVVSEIYPRPTANTEKPLHVNEIPNKDGVEHVAVTDRISTDGHPQKVHDEVSSELPYEVTSVPEDLSNEFSTEPTQDFRPKGTMPPAASSGEEEIGEEITPKPVHTDAETTPEIIETQTEKASIPEADKEINSTEKPSQNTDEQHSETPIKNTHDTSEHIPDYPTESSSHEPIEIDNLVTEAPILESSEGPTSEQGHSTEASHSSSSIPDRIVFPTETYEEDEKEDDKKPSTESNVNQSENSSETEADIQQTETPTLSNESEQPTTDHKNPEIVNQPEHESAGISERPTEPESNTETVAQHETEITVQPEVETEEAIHQHIIKEHEPSEVEVDLANHPEVHTESYIHDHTVPEVESESVETQTVPAVPEHHAQPDPTSEEIPPEQEFDVTTQRSCYEEPTEINEHKVTGDEVAQHGFESYDDTTEQVSVTTSASLGHIPGEGSCRLDKETFTNNTDIPPRNKCQKRCRCVSSIVHCESVECPPQPPGMKNCVPHLKENECCPSYLCDGEDQPAPQSGSHITEETVTEVIGNRIEDFPPASVEDKPDKFNEVTDHHEVTTAKTFLESSTAPVFESLPQTVVPYPHNHQSSEEGEVTETEEQTSNEVDKNSQPEESSVPTEKDLSIEQTTAKHQEEEYSEVKVTMQVPNSAEQVTLPAIHQSDNEIHHDGSVEFNENSHVSTEHSIKEETTNKPESNPTSEEEMSPTERIEIVTESPALQENIQTTDEIDHDAQKPAEHITEVLETMPEKVLPIDISESPVLEPAQPTESTVVMQEQINSTEMPSEPVEDVMPTEVTADDVEPIHLTEKPSEATESVVPTEAAVEKDEPLSATELPSEDANSTETTAEEEKPLDATETPSKTADSVNPTETTERTDEAEVEPIKTTEKPSESADQVQPTLPPTKLHHQTAEPAEVDAEPVKSNEATENPDIEDVYPTEAESVPTTEETVGADYEQVAPSEAPLEVEPVPSTEKTVVAGVEFTHSTETPEVEPVEPTKQTIESDFEPVQSTEADIEPVQPTEAVIGDEKMPATVAPVGIDSEQDKAKPVQTTSNDVDVTEKEFQMTEYPLKTGINDHEITENNENSMDIKSSTETELDVQDFTEKLTDQSYQQTEESSMHVFPSHPIESDNQLAGTEVPIQAHTDSEDNELTKKPEGSFEVVTEAQPITEALPGVIQGGEHQPTKQVENAAAQPPEQTAIPETDHFSVTEIAQEQTERPTIDQDEPTATKEPEVAHIQTELPKITHSEQTELPEVPLIEETEESDVSHSEQTEQPQVPHAEQTEEPDVSHIEQTEEPEVSHIEQTEQPEVSHIEQTEESEVSHIEQTEQPEVSHIEQTEQPEVSHTEQTEESEVSHIEQTEQPDVSHIEQTEQPEVSHIEQTEQPEASHIEQTEQPEVSHIEQTEESDVSHVEQTQIPHAEQTEEPEVPQIEQTELSIDPLIEQTETPKEQNADSFVTEEPVRPESSHTEQPIKNYFEDVQTSSEYPSENETPEIETTEPTESLLAPEVNKPEHTELPSEHNSEISTESANIISSEVPSESDETSSLSTNQPINNDVTNEPVSNDVVDVTDTPVETDEAPVETTERINIDEISETLPHVTPAEEAETTVMPLDTSSEGSKYEETPIDSSLESASHGSDIPHNLDGATSLPDAGEQVEVEPTTVRYIEEEVSSEEANGLIQPTEDSVSHLPENELENEKDSMKPTHTEVEQGVEATTEPNAYHETVTESQSVDENSVEQEGSGSHETELSPVPTEPTIVDESIENGADLTTQKSDIVAPIDENISNEHSTESPHDDHNTVQTHDEENQPQIHATEQPPTESSHEEIPESQEVAEGAAHVTVAPDSQESSPPPHEEAEEAPEVVPVKPESEKQTEKPTEITVDEEKLTKPTAAPVYTSPPPIISTAKPKPSTTTPKTTTTTTKKPYQKPQKPIEEYDSLDEDKPGQEYLPTDEYDQEEEEQPYGPGTCRYAGKVYVSAQQIPRDDPCDFCFCFRSDIICLQQSCPPPIPGCHEEPISGFCCPRYECHVRMATMVNMTSTTTTTTTTLPPHFLTHAYKKGVAARQGCLVQGRAYQVGQSIPTASGPCMDCICGGDGSMKCEPKVCTPEPMIRQMMVNQESTIKHR